MPYGERMAKTQKPSREDRLKQALKANMARRKAQARARAAPDDAGQRATSSKEGSDGQDSGQR
ncbi:hypothetical protein [Vannielia sp.]|uniref:hypothetical protein n=1 Tax=Vannielia sp. TaxID=2813045 RepID=UPI002619F09D|nr:hypothetical protein [Vannielia sp.]MDF1872009.1 hypothetical protein [Vannielia sp.]